MPSLLEIPIPCPSCNLTIAHHIRAEIAGMYVPLLHLGAGRVRTTTQRVSCACGNLMTLQMSKLTWEKMEARYIERMCRLLP